MDHFRRDQLQSYACPRARLEDGVKLLLAGNVFPITRKYPLTVARNWAKIKYVVNTEFHHTIIFVEQEAFEQACERRLRYAKELIQDYEADQGQQPEPEPVRPWMSNRTISVYRGTPLIEHARKDPHFPMLSREIEANYEKIKQLSPVLPAKLGATQPVAPPPGPPLQEKPPQQKAPRKTKTPAKPLAKIIPFKRREPVE